MTLTEIAESFAEQLNSTEIDHHLLGTFVELCHTANETGLIEISVNDGTALIIFKILKLSEQYGLVSNIPSELKL